MPEPLIKIRPSRADLLDACIASHHPDKDEPLIDNTDYEEPANIGKAAHDIFAMEIEGKTWEIVAVCAKWNVKEEDLKHLAWTASQYSQELPKMFPDVPQWESEKPLSHHTPFALRGTTDVIGVSQDQKTVVTADLKTERLEMEHICQMKSYGHMSMNAFPKAEKVTALIFWARDLEIQKWTWTREELMKWAEDLRERAWNWNGVDYTVGTHCIYCRRQYNCAARQAQLRSAYTLMTREEMPMDMTGEKMAVAWRAHTEIKNIMDSWHTRIKERVLATGPIDLGEGKTLCVKERNTAPDIDTEKAIKVLNAGFGFEDKEFYACCRVLGKAVEDTVAAKAPQGKKGAARKEVVNALIEHGALTPKTTMVLSVSKAEKELTSSEKPV